MEYKKLYKEHRKVNKEKSVTYDAFVNRIRKLGWPVEKAINTSTNTIDIINRATRTVEKKNSNKYWTTKQAYKEHRKLNGENSVGYTSFCTRIYVLGWSIEKAVNTKKRQTTYKKEYKEHCKLHGKNRITYHSFEDRIKRGRGVEYAIKEGSQMNYIDPVLYTKHVEKHKEKSVTQRQFYRRLRVMNRDIKKAINTPYLGWGGDRKGN